MSLTVIDVLLTASLASAAFGGFRLGFVTRVASWVFMATGVGLSLYLLPLILRWVDTIDVNSRLLLVVLVVLVGALLGQMVGLFVGSRIAAIVPKGPLRIGDKVLGAVAGVAGVILLTWLVLPAAANVPGFPAQQVRQSELAQAIYDLTPNAPDASNTLRRLVGTETFPSVFDDLRAAPDTGPPPQSVEIPRDVLDRVTLSTVKVEGTACRRTQDGSGFAVAPHLIATNAHVVAGESETSVLTPRGNSYKATVVYFDPARDIALLQVPNYDAAPLPLAKASIDDVGAVFGHPLGQDSLAIEPAKVSQRIVAQGQDLYDKETTRRNVLVLSSVLRQGDSGGALINTDGEVVGVAFAIAPDKADTAYALDIDELHAALATPRKGAVSTQECIVD